MTHCSKTQTGLTSRSRPFFIWCLFSKRLGPIFFLFFMIIFSDFKNDTDYHMFFQSLLNLVILKGILSFY